MTRIAFIAIGLAGSVIAAAAMVPSTDVTGTVSVKETVIAKNQAWPNAGPLVFEDCATATCED